MMRFCFQYFSRLYTVVTVIISPLNCIVGSSSCSSDSDEDSGGTGVVGKKRRPISLASLLQSEGSNAYHPTLHTASKQPQPVKTKSFSSLKPFKSPSNQVKIDQSEHRVHKKAAIPVREELDDLTLSHQEAAVAKTGSRNLERLLRTEKFWC